MTPAKPPAGIAERVLFAPLERAPLRPDIVVFLCNAWQGARLVNLAYYQTGLPMNCDPTGSLCRSAITYRLVTGRVNVTFGDVTARELAGDPEDLLLVCVPYSHLVSIVDSIDGCGAGTAPREMPPRLEGERRGE